MSNYTRPHDDAEFEDANSRLAEGLESCRTLIKSYQAVLGNEAMDGDDPTAERSE